MIKHVSLALLAVATLSFTAGLFTPFCELCPTTGDPALDALITWLGIDFSRQSYSIVHGIVSLLNGGPSDVCIAIILGLFTVALPLWKLAALWQLAITRGSLVNRRMQILELVGPWSMMDVFVVSLCVLAFRSFPGGTTVAVRYGFGLYFISVICMLAATVLIRRRRMRETPVAIS